MFIEEYKDVLKKRYSTFKFAFDYLKYLSKPICIIETGCARQGESKEAFEGDGLSTLLFGRFVKEETQGFVITIDISKQNLVSCSQLTKAYNDVIVYIQGDSVKILDSLTEVSQVDLLYLDSMDMWADNPEPSMLHHEREIRSVHDRLPKDALVMVDDNRDFCSKGKYVKDFLLARDWKLLNSESDYQWIFGRI